MLTRIFDSLLEPTFLINQEAKVIYCNEAASLICDLSVRKIMRSRPRLDEIFSFDVKIEAFADVGSITEATPYQELSFTTESGKSGRVQITVQSFQPTETGEASWLVYFRDVTLEETLQRKYRAELEKKESVIHDLERAQAQLEEYSKNLEKMVAERTAQLLTINGQMKALLDSLGQGFLIFNSEGRCLDIASKACENILEKDPRGLGIAEVLGLKPGKEADSFRKWMVTAFDEMLPFEDLAPLAPNRYSHSKGKTIDLSYYPIRSESGQIESLVLVATDITDLMEAQRIAQEERSYAQMIIQLVQNKRQVLGFVREADSLLAELRQELSKAEPNHELSFRLLHSLKGGAASFSILEVAEKTHQGEDALSAWSKDKSPEKLHSLRAKSREIQKSFEHFLEQNSNILGSRETQSLSLREISGVSLRAFYERLGDPSLREAFFREFLLESAASQFNHLNEVLQQTAVKMGKIVAPLIVDDPDFKFWPEAYESLLTSFIHALRNSVDHGIESPDRREAAGKSTEGHIRIRASMEGGLLVFRIQDDGGGIDVAKVRSRSAEKGRDLSAMSDHEVMQQVFASEFSTRDEVTEISGRGVGMDAIMIEAKKLGGRAWVDSVLGQGMTLTVAVPWITDLSRPALKIA